MGWIVGSGLELPLSRMLAGFAYIDAALRDGIRRSVRAVPGLIYLPRRLDAYFRVRLPAALTTSLLSRDCRSLSLSPSVYCRTSRQSQRGRSS